MDYQRIVKDSRMIYKDIQKVLRVIHFHTSPLRKIFWEHFYYLKAKIPPLSVPEPFTGVMLVLLFISIGYFAFKYQKFLKRHALNLRYTTQARKRLIKTVFEDLRPSYTRSCPQKSCFAENRPTRRTTTAITPERFAKLDAKHRKLQDGLMGSADSIDLLEKLIASQRYTDAYILRKQKNRDESDSITVSGSIEELLDGCDRERRVENMLPLSLHMPRNISESNRLIKSVDFDRIRAQQDYWNNLDTETTVSSMESNGSGRLGYRTRK